jgi:hypothetical protein
VGPRQIQIKSVVPSLYVLAPSVRTRIWDRHLVKNT